MAQKIDLLKTAKEKAAQAGEFFNDTAADAKNKAAKAGAFLSDTATDTKNKAAQASEFLSDKATEAKEKATQTSEMLSDKAAEAKRDYDLRRFKPITRDQLEGEMRKRPDMIHITGWDKRTEENVCKDAVAFNDGSKEMQVISVLTQNAKLMDASFYPAIQEGVYYRDPCNPSLFINLSDYFSYLKKARVHELNQIAQDLGAKRIRIVLKAEKQSSVQNKGKIGTNAGKILKAEASHKDNSVEFESLEIASDKVFKGHEAQMPNLNYFRNEPDILNIIKRRLDKNNPIFSDTETFKFINSSGKIRTDASKIDSVLKKLKVDGNITQEVRKEESLFFEYHIEYPEE